MDNLEVRERVARTEALLQEIEALPDARTRHTVMQAVQALLELYGEALTRLLQHSSRWGGETLLQALADDELVGHMLLLHGLHPQDMAARVEQALDGVRPYLQSHGGNVALLGVEGGVVRLQLLGSCNGCAGSTITLQTAVEQAIYELAPEVQAIEAEGAAAPLPTSSFVPLASLL